MGTVTEFINLLPYKITVFFAYSFACYNIVHSLLKDKSNTVLTFLAIFFTKLFTAFLIFKYSLPKVIGLLIFETAVFIIIILLTSGKTVTKLLCIASDIISQIISSLITNLLPTIILQGKDFNEIYKCENGLISPFLFLKCIVVITVSFAFSAVFRLINPGSKHKRSKNMYAYFALLPLSHILIITIILLLVRFGCYTKVEIDGTIGTVITFLTFLIVLFDCSFNPIIDYFERLEEQNINAERKLLKNELDYQQMLMIKEEKQQLKKVKHDLINIATTAKGFIEINCPEKAKAILQNTTDDLIGINDFSVCTSETVNTVLYMKTKQAKNSNILLNIDISESFSLLPSDYDICRLLGNLIDNALNATNQISESRACSICISIDKEKILITTENPFTVQKKRPIDKSGKHGNGINIIKEITQKYNGKFIQTQDSNKWYTETMLQNKRAKNSTPPPNFELILTLFVNSYFPHPLYTSRKNLQTYKRRASIVRMLALRFIQSF